MFERSEKKTKFYNSSAWRKLARSYATGKAWICESCLNKNLDYSKLIYKQLHCHHKIELTDNNIEEPNIALNENNLILLCQVCHNRITTAKEVLAEGLEFDECGMIRKRSR